MVSSKRPSVFIVPSCSLSQNISDANHNLALIAVSLNKVDVALPLFKTALEANPQKEQFWASYIDALIKEKQFESAKKVLDRGKKAGWTEKQGS